MKGGGSACFGGAQIAHGCFPICHLCEWHETAYQIHAKKGLRTWLFLKQGQASRLQAMWDHGCGFGQNLTDEPLSTELPKGLELFPDITVVWGSYFCSRLRRRLPPAHSLAHSLMAFAHRRRHWTGWCRVVLRSGQFLRGVCTLSSRRHSTFICAGPGCFRGRVRTLRLRKPDCVALSCGGHGIFGLLMLDFVGGGGWQIHSLIHKHVSSLTHAPTLPFVLHHLSWSFV